MSLTALYDALEAAPVFSLAHLPTPIERLDSIEAVMAEEGTPCPALYIKRDDATGLAFGGNKTRKLEYLVGAALEAEATRLVTTGAVQSNHCRQTAAAARARLGPRRLAHRRRYALFYACAALYSSRSLA